jgi:hypothetical protein
MRKQQNADLKVGATKSQHPAGKPAPPSGKSGSKLPHSKAPQLTILAYFLPPVKRHKVHFGPARGRAEEERCGPTLCTPDAGSLARYFW